MDFWDHTSKHQQLAEPPTKRISTPAGQRLSVILENADVQAKTSDSHRGSIRKTRLATALVGDMPRESSEDQSNNSSGYSHSVWSDGEKFSALMNHKQIAKRGGWKKIIIIIAIIIALVIALAAGLAVGLKKKGSSSSGTNDDSSSSDPQAVNPTATATAPLTLTPTALPTNFPVGSYSLITFLDTVQDNCTSPASTWTCYPYTIYNTDHSKSVATFNWIISGSSPNLKISSTANPFSISFQNADLELLDEGKDEERYRFQLQTKKTVSPSTSIMEDGAAVECDYNDSSLTGWLYTKMEKGYPNVEHGDGTVDPSFPVWPFAVRVEQSAAGGQDVPSCHKTSSPQTPLTDVIEDKDVGSLCSCLYRNWITPIPA